MQYYKYLYIQNFICYIFKLLLYCLNYLNFLAKFVR